MRYITGPITSMPATAPQAAPAGRDDARMSDTTCEPASVRLGASRSEAA